MATDNPEDSDYVRSELFQALMDKVNADVYPSSTMLDMIESLLTPQEVAVYADALLDRIRADEFPSISLLRRVQNLA